MDQSRAEYLLMNDDATVTELTRCDDCGFLFRDIAQHVAESVTVPAVEGEPITDHGFAWVGQSMNGCETCGRPLWDHEGVAVLKAGSGFLKPDWEIVSYQEAARRMPLFGHYAGIKVDA